MAEPRRRPSKSFRFVRSVGNHSAQLMKAPARRAGAFILPNSARLRCQVLTVHPFPHHPGCKDHHMREPAVVPDVGPPLAPPVATVVGSHLFVNRNGPLPPNLAGDLGLDLFPVFGVDARREVLPAGVCEEADDVAAVELAGHLVRCRGHGA